MSKDSKGTFECIRKEGIKSSLIYTKHTDMLQKMRYKKVSIFSSAFYMILLNALCIADNFFNEKLVETIFSACLSHCSLWVIFGE